MDLPKELKSKIADQIVRVVAPAIFFGMILNAIGILLIGGEQYQRLIPAALAFLLVIPSWLFARKGKPLVGIVFIIACFCTAAVAGMIVSGGIHALSYTATLVIITVFTVLYGARGGIAFAVFTIATGGLFIILIKHGILHEVDKPTTAYLFLLHAIFLTMQFFFVLIPVRLMFKALMDSKQQSMELEKAMIERKQVQGELQSILNKTPDIIYRLDPEGKITFINEAVRKYGHRPENLIGKSILEFVHPDDRAAANHQLIERRSGERSASELEVRLSILSSPDTEPPEKTNDKKWSVFHIFSEGLYADDKTFPTSFIGVQAIAHDISRIRHFEQQVDRLAAVVEQAAEDVMITNQEGVIQYVNPRFEEVTGYTLSELVGKTPRIFKSGKHDDAFYANIWKSITRGEIWKGRIWNRIKNGRLILQDVTITPIFDATHRLTGYASVRRDITEQERTQEQLQQTQKMEAIGTLAGGIAHDFNNILSAIIGYTELALQDVKDRPSTKEMLERVLEAGGRATELVRQILSFSRSQKSEVKPISPAGIAGEVINLMRASLPSTIEIKQSINSASYVLADATNIHQVLMNLCTNAAHAMKQKGGVLSISLEDVTLGPDDLSHLPNVLPGEFLKISVEDTGKGMTTDIQKKAFDPFFTTKELGKGTGMGLATVHGIVTDLSGFISLYSEPNQGTAISVFIPLIPKPAKIAGRPAGAPMQGGTERILFVDDEQIQVELAQSALTRYGYQVTIHSESTVALAHFQQDPGAYDLVVTDMTMPKMTGDILTQKIHLIRPDIPVIMITGFSEIIDEQKAEALEINAFLYKPVVIANLLDTIRKVLDRNK